jgi:hypothetical protein
VASFSEIIGRVAGDEGAGGGDEFRLEFLRERLVDENALNGNATLAGLIKRTGEEARDGVS